MRFASTEIDPVVEAVAPSRAMRALRDLLGGWNKSWIWMALALQDIRLRYRGSILGPFWLTFSTAVMVVTLGAIYGRLLKADSRSYVPYLAIGLVTWQLISAVVNEGCDTFVGARSIIHQVPIPFSVHAFRVVCRNFLVLAHTAVLVPIVLLLYRPSVGWPLLAVVPALLLLAINCFWVAILFGMVSARFRDVPPIVANFMQVAFFITPIFWSPEALGTLKKWVEYNPFFAAIDIVRAPMIGAAPAPQSWPVMLLATLIGGGITFALFARFRARIAYWI